MHEIGKKILFGDLQIQKRNQQRRIHNELVKNLALFKAIPDDEDFEEIYNYLYDNKSTNKYITVNLFPTNMNAMAQYREVGFSSQVQYELRWHMKTFSKYVNTINQFLEQKTVIDELILLNQYEKALDFLDGLEYQYGASYWLLENKIHLWNKLEKDTQKEIVEKTGNSVLTTILSFYDMRTSDEVSSRDYDYFTRREIAKFKRINPDGKRIISFYHYMIAPFSFEMDDENLLYILGFVHNLPLIDRYLCIIDICEYILSKSIDKENLEYIKKYINYMKDIKDPTVETFLFMLDTKENRKKYTIEDSASELKNKYILGDIENCYKDAIKYIKENTSNVSVYNIFLESCQILGKTPEEIDVSDNIKMLLKNLNSVYSIDENYNDAIDEVYKLCFCSIHAAWSRDVYNYITRCSQPHNSNLQKIAMMYTNMQKLTIETVCENLPKEDAIDYLEKYENSDDKYINFWKDYIKGNYSDAASKCGLLPLKVLLTLMSSDTYSDFEKELQDSNELAPIFKIRISKIMWDNMTYESYIEEGIDYFIHIFIQQENYAVIAPMNKFIGYFKENTSVDKSNLRVPILYYIYTTYFDSDRRDELSYVCEDFFLYNDIEKPSLMAEFDKAYSKEELVFFLRYVCIPQIMGPVLLSIRSAKDLDQERINTCQYLRIIDSENEDAYEQEIQEITHKLFINDGLNTIENSKIHVNTEGIKSRISKTLKSAFSNYMYYRNHKIDAVLESIKNFEGGENLEIITFDTSQMFSEIVNTIRNEFVSSGEYGLDGYLSMNIRHGTLAGQLRSPLAKVDLLTTYHVESNSYEVNPRWYYKVKSASDIEKIKSAIIDFNVETDAIIEYLRKTLIQISTEEKPTKGIFDYAWKAGEISTLQTFLTENIAFEDFIDKMFDYLWGITEQNLIKMKEVIRNEIKQKYIDAFANVQTVMRGINAKESFPEALRWLNEAQNDVDAELEKICNWFKRSAESQHADFDMDLALQIGLKMIQNIHPEKTFEIKELTKSIDYQIPGVYLKNYWNIFYTLFDNVCKYAQEENGIKYISCDLKVKSSGIFIKMMNAYDCSNGIGTEVAKIKAALSIINDKTYLARAKQEGGSGIPKIYKILSVDLDKKADIKCNFLPDKNLFTIEIEGRNK